MITDKPRRLVKVRKLAALDFEPWPFEARADISLRLHERECQKALELLKKSKVELTDMLRAGPNDCVLNLVCSLSISYEVLADLATILSTARARLLVALAALEEPRDAHAPCSAKPSRRRQSGTLS
jgi:hypothetical protein